MRHLMVQEGHGFHSKQILLRIFFGLDTMREVLADVFFGSIIKRRHFFQSLHILLAAVIVISASACNNRRKELTSAYPADYRDRHPIALVDKDRSIDIFITSATGLDVRQKRDLRDFANDYRRGAKSSITLKVPADPKKPLPFEVKNTLRALWQTLASAGVQRGTVRVQYYRDQSGYPVSLPIRLSFTKLGAQVVSECGQWPTDIAGGDSLESWENRPYWNLGCSSQQILAAQVADPLDLVRGRQEERIDTVKRMTGVEKLRKGQDPSTQYRVQSTTTTNVQ